ncbi:MAG: branched-chain amino acid aminotransferase [Rhodospirillaceae bacterium]|nr:MAG: branched-chain amino acid aminotransferase [Rhodospirillaceae bacterium]
MILNLNGTLMTAEAARIDPADRGVTLGDGLFETMAVREGRVARLPAHLRRLREGARLLRLPLPETDALLSDRLYATLTANALSEGILRLTVTRGVAGRGLAIPIDAVPTVLVTASPSLPPEQPVHAVIATVTRRNQYSPLSRLKSLNALDAILAREEAAARGAMEAVLLNTEGRLAETTIATLFLVLEGRVHTPPVADGALPGVMRADVIRGLGGEETPLVPADLFRATEVFVTNALGVRPMLTVDGRPVGGATRAQETVRILSSKSAPLGFWES